jgi:hypothetical protein
MSFRLRRCGRRPQQNLVVRQTIKSIKFSSDFRSKNMAFLSRRRLASELETFGEVVVDKVDVFFVAKRPTSVQMEFLLPSVSPVDIAHWVHATLGGAFQADTRKPV